MSEVVIAASGVGKRYRIGALQDRRDTLRDQIVYGTQRLKRAAREGLRRTPPTDFWALKDVSFEIERGSVVGVIGHNGAGKSTLLKVLSSITPPTEGRIAMRGRVGSLLEVGTGFHPELSGRENVFLSGAIMGMRRAEIRKKFDEIVAFAEVEDFIDTPVKRYSSGMYVRLAFGVAAFLEPEILLIDEVLAVGDAKFQRKCIGKMGSVAREGRTVLLVSHNMGAVNQLCPTAIWLESGRVRDLGETGPIVRSYLAKTDAGSSGSEVTLPLDETKDSQLVAVRVASESGSAGPRFSCDEAVVVELDYLVRRTTSGLYGCLEVDAVDGTPVLISYSYDLDPNPFGELPRGLHTVRVTIPARSLAAGDYRVDFSVARGHKATVAVDTPGTIARFSLDDVRTLKGNRRIGYFSSLLDWSVTPAEARVKVRHG